MAATCVGIVTTAFSSGSRHSFISKIDGSVHVISRHPHARGTPPHFPLTAVAGVRTRRRGGRAVRSAGAALVGVGKTAMFTLCHTTEPHKGGTINNASEDLVYDGLCMGRRARPDNNRLAQSEEATTCSRGASLAWT
jgi:hypothetical protein